MSHERRHHHQLYIKVNISFTIKPKIKYALQIYSNNSNQPLNFSMEYNKTNGLKIVPVLK